MGIILFLIIILLVSGGGLFFLRSFDEKFVSLQKSNLLLKSQLAKIKEKYDLLDSSTQNINLEFLNVDNHYGLLPQGTIIRICPSNNSSIVQKINIGMQVGILEKVITDNQTWYYVALPVDSNINSRGWVQESAFTSISDSQIEISKN